MSRIKVTVSWSGGKDSAFALYKILNEKVYEVVNLHTVIDEESKRVGLHGVSEELIEQQADCLDLPLTKIYLTASHDSAPYETVMRSYYRQCAREGIQGVVFGDIFLEDLRTYREQLLAGSQLLPFYPLWKRDTTELYEEFIQAGFRTLICAADASMFTEAQLGITLDVSTPEGFKEGVDICGENGEFHTFVYDGPVFKQPVIFERGRIVKKKYTYGTKGSNGKTEISETSFLFQDLVVRRTSR